ncbi:MAG: hypothetical protein MZV64_58685 [Ignavibacteriales bacterium]|nr:hypothetical protein [Ignavibacteriales bacterium]
MKVDSAALDSTARMKYFKYQREDKPYVELKKKKQSKFFAQPDQRFSNCVQFKLIRPDNLLKLLKKLPGRKLKLLLKMPIDDYIQMRLGLREREIWENIGYAYELKETKKELSELIKDITNLEIPSAKCGCA